MITAIEMRADEDRCKRPGIWCCCWGFQCRIYSFNTRASTDNRKLALSLPVVTHRWVHVRIDSEKTRVAKRSESHHKSNNVSKVSYSFKNSECPRRVYSSLRWELKGRGKRWYFWWYLSFLRYPTDESSMIMEFISWRPCPKIFSCRVTISCLYRGTLPIPVEIPGKFVGNFPTPPTPDPLTLWGTPRPLTRTWDPIYFLEKSNRITSIIFFLVPSIVNHRTCHKKCAGTPKFVNRPQPRGSYVSRSCSEQTFRSIKDYNCIYIPVLRKT